MRTAIYCRVSTESQEVEGTSLQTQCAACLKKAQELGYETDATYLEAYSGLTLTRPKMSELRDLVQSGQIDAVIAYALDRVSRDPVDFIILQEELERAKVELILVTETVDSSDMGKLISHIKGFAAKLEAQKIKERTTRGRKERIRLGRLPTGRGVLYGYDYDKERGINIANKDLDTLKTVGRWIIQEHVSLNEVCRRLMAQGVPAPKGGKLWSRGSVGRIMRNSTYVGKSFAGRTATEGKKRVLCSQDKYIEVPNAVDQVVFTPDEWQKIQYQLERNKELSPRNQKLDYLLSGRLYCQRCGRKLYGVPMHGKPFYKCTGRNKLMHPEDYCHSSIVHALNLDKQVWTEVEKVLRDPKTILVSLVKNASGGEKVLLETESARIERQLNKLDRDQEQLLSWALNGFPPKTVILENTKINGQRANLTARQSEIAERILELQNNAMDLKRIEEYCQTASSNLANYTLQDKKHALEVFKVRVTVDGHSATLEGKLPPELKNSVVASQPL